MRLSFGTSGFSYKEWKGTFYPKDLKNDQMLAFYSQRLPAVEINNTFYRFPKAAMLEGWAEQVPANFRFVLKASRSITHLKRLKEVGDSLEYLVKTSNTLEDRLGLIFFQLPGNFRKDVQRLTDFLNLIPLGTPIAFEFRHTSWFDDEVFALLKQFDCALCYVDGEDAVETPWIETAPWGYLRLRRDHYSESDLGHWAEKIGDAAWEEAFVFFKHEGSDGPQFAEQLLATAGARAKQ